MKRAAVVLVAFLALAGCASVQDAATPRTVEPVVTAATVDADGFLHASAYVEGVVESGGTCRFTFWADWGGASRLTSKASVVDGRTECGDVEEHIRPLRAGEYELVVTYESDSAEGESKPYSVSIPEH